METAKFKQETRHGMSQEGFFCVFFKNRIQKTAKNLKVTYA
jgi:hypothetical protein